MARRARLGGHNGPVPQDPWLSTHSACGTGLSLRASSLLLACHKFKFFHKQPTACELSGKGWMNGLLGPWCLKGATKRPQVA